MKGVQFDGKFTLYWRDGGQEVVVGSTIVNALTRAGYGNGALRALDFFVEGFDDSYVFTKDGWTKKEVQHA